MSVHRQTQWFISVLMNKSRRWGNGVKIHLRPPKLSLQSPRGPTWPEATECSLTCCSAGCRRWLPLTLKRAFKIALRLNRPNWKRFIKWCCVTRRDLTFFRHFQRQIELSFSSCVLSNFVLDFFPFVPRLQSFPGGFRAFPTIHQVLCYIWQICEWNRIMSSQREGGWMCYRHRLIELHDSLDFSDGQTPLPQDEWGEFLRAVHGGARHPARQASVRDGHRGVCQPTPKVCSYFSFLFRVDSASYVCDYFQGDTAEATGWEYVWNMGEWTCIHHTNDHFTV